MPGAPMLEVGWPGTKNAESHRIWLSKPVQALLKDRQRGFVLSGRKPLNVNSLSNFMREDLQ